MIGAMDLGIADRANRRHAAAPNSVRYPRSASSTKRLIDSPKDSQENHNSSSPFSHSQGHKPQCSGQMSAQPFGGDIEIVGRADAAENAERHAPYGFLNSGVNYWIIHWVAGMNGDPLDPVQELKRRAVFACNALQGLAPVAVEKGVRCADARACAGAFLSRMISTSVFTARKVCVRARDLISVMVRCFRALRSASLANPISEHLFFDSPISVICAISLSVISISMVETQKTRGENIRRGRKQTRLDDAILPVFFPARQTTIVR